MKGNLLWRSVVDAKRNVLSTRVTRSMSALAAALTGNARSLSGQCATSPGTDGTRLAAVLSYRRVSLGKRNSNLTVMYLLWVGMQGCLCLMFRRGCALLPV